MPRLSIFERSVIFAALGSVVCSLLSSTKVSTKVRDAPGGAPLPLPLVRGNNEAVRAELETNVFDLSKSLNLQAPCQKCIKLPDKLGLSAGGFLWEYYHFMTDFSPVLLEYVSNMSKSPQCTVVYGNGFYMNLIMSIRDFHMEEKWDFFFGTPFNLKYVYRGDHPMPAECSEVNWKAWWGMWASGPAKQFLDFRTHGYQQAGLDSSATPTGVILIKRGEKGKERRSIDDRFYDVASKALDDRAIRYQVIDMENMTQKDQVIAFANAKVVVGQHGAGLSNINWMKNGTTLIELGERKWKCFRNLARAVNLNYIQYAALEWTSDLENLIQHGADELAMVVWTLTSVAQTQLVSHKMTCPAMSSACDFA